MDINGYPTEEEIAKIKQWPNTDFKGLMAFIKEECWWMPDWGWSNRGKTYRVSTGGWSGNEEIIDALHKNDNFFWALCWQSSRRGGHYVFRLYT